MGDTVERSVFIVGCPRTGSTLQQLILSDASDYAILPEAHILSPRYLRKDFASRLSEIIDSKIGKTEIVDRILRLVKDDDLFGVYWEEVRRGEMDFGLLREELLKIDCFTVPEVVHAVLVSYMRYRKKRYIGAKFLVHIKYAETIFEWYPSSKMVHAVRDPRAIYASQFYKHGGVRKFSLKNIFIGIVQLMHIAIYFNQAARMHLLLKGKPGYLMVRYEDFVSNPDVYMKQWCDHLGLDYEKAKDILSVRVNSSFNESSQEKKSGKELDQGALDYWRKKIPPLTEPVMKLLTRRSMKVFGY